MTLNQSAIVTASTSAADQTLTPAQVQVANLLDLTLDQPAAIPAPSAGPSGNLLDMTVPDSGDGNVFDMTASGLPKWARKQEAAGVTNVEDKDDQTLPNWAKAERIEDGQSGSVLQKWAESFKEKHDRFPVVWIGTI